MSSAPTDNDGDLPWGARGGTDYAPVDPGHMVRVSGREANQSLVRECGRVIENSCHFLTFPANPRCAALTVLARLFPARDATWLM